MPEDFLYQDLDRISKWEPLPREMPRCITDNLSPNCALRPYQVKAFARFFRCLNGDFPGKEYPLHFAWNMATGSGKTLIMTGLILYLYERGYRNFLFFVNSTNIIEKTKDNFLNPLSSKYLFAEGIQIGGRRIAVTPVANFEGANPDDINLCFTTIQKLHLDVNSEKENALTFEDFRQHKIVLIADEAHHINTQTKADQVLFESWENTVEKIFHQNEDNLLLEFTATLDYSYPSIVNKYRRKVLYKYDLREYRNDKYSKDVYIVQSEFEEKERILQAVILSQYKQEVAAKHRLNLKPVILFKAQRTIAQSQENKAKFHKIIDGLTPKDLETVRRKSNIPLVQRAFDFFDANGISLQQLTARLKAEFEEHTRCLSVNEESEKESYQLLLNSLEDRNNRIRAIFAVQKLNEGWDVLNLFDIVRCYTERDSKAGKPGKTTISEAQLIGRGARYFPFTTPDSPERFQRKFDKDLTNELRVLEELHYHSINDSRYIAELRTALVEEGLIDEEEVVRELRLKESFKESEFYLKGLIYLNERIVNKYEHVKSFPDLGVSKKNHVRKISTGRGTVDSALGVDGQPGMIAEAGRKDVRVKEMGRHIVQNALARNPFFNFDSVKRYFPHVKSMREFVDSEDYLGGLSITFQGESKDTYRIANEEQLAALSELLARIEAEVRQNIAEYRGTDRFKPNSIDKIFGDKTLKLNKENERAKGQEELVADREWYVFNANYGTSEEKAFVRMLDSQMDRLQERYDGIYLVRNEGHFQIYNFADGQAFEPDYVLYLKQKNGEVLTYQLFIEPKGKHLKEHDRWKEDFLKEITDRFRDRVLHFSASAKYRLIGVPFYNNEDENRFRESLYQALEG